MGGISDVFVHLKFIEHKFTVIEETTFLQLILLAQYVWQQMNV